MEWLLSLTPRNMSPSGWELLLEDSVRDAARSGPAWEEMVATWVALYSLLQAEDVAQGLGIELPELEVYVIALNACSARCVWVKVSHSGC